MLPHPDRLETQLFSEARVGRPILAAPLPQKSPKFHFFTYQQRFDKPGVKRNIRL